MKMQILILGVWVGPKIWISHLIPGDALAATFPWIPFEKQGSSTFLPLLALASVRKSFKLLSCWFIVFWVLGLIRSLTLRDLFIFLLQTVTLEKGGEWHLRAKPQPGYESYPCPPLSPPHQLWCSCSCGDLVIKPMWKGGGWERVDNIDFSRKASGRETLTINVQDIFLSHRVSASLDFLLVCFWCLLSLFWCFRKLLWNI